MSENSSPLVGVIMGSQSDWETMKEASTILKEFGVEHECRVVSAHRTPDWMNEYAKDAEQRGLEVIIAGAGGAAHLPGVVAAQIGCSCEEPGAAGAGFAAVDRTDAGRRTCWHTGDWGIGSEERGTAGDSYPGEFPS